MAYEILLHDFIDGSLEYGDEVALFAELHVNEELRRELKLLMSMRQAAANDSRAYTPAPGSQEAIFSRLGFGPAAHSEAERYPMLGGYRPHVVQGIIGGLVGAVIVALLMIGSDHRSVSNHGLRPAAPETTISAVAGTGSTAQPLLSAIGTAYSGTAAAAGHGGRTISHVSSGAVPPAGRPSLLAARQTSPARVELAAAPNIMTRELTPSPLRTLTPSPDRTHSGEALQSGTPASLRSPHRGESPSDDATSDDVAGILVEYRNRHSLSSRRVPVEIVPTSTPLLRDKSIGMYYRLNRHQAAGIEVGQEDFLQIYREELPNGDLMEHQQDPLLLWGGVSFRQSIFEAERFAPYVQGLLGATAHGPFGRFSAGTSFTLAPQLQVFAAGEIGALAYDFGGSWYVSPRYGFTYGLSVGF